MTLKEYYDLAMTKKEKTITDLLVIEIYNLKNDKKKGSDK